MQWCILFPWKFNENQSYDETQHNTDMHTQMWFSSPEGHTTWAHWWTGGHTYECLQNWVVGWGSSISKMFTSIACHSSFSVPPTLKEQVKLKCIYPGNPGFRCIGLCLTLSFPNTFRLPKNLLSSFCCIWTSWLYSCYGAQAAKDLIDQYCGRWLLLFSVYLRRTFKPRRREESKQSEWRSHSWIT